MNHIERLLATHCPDGVSYQQLGDIATLLRGNGMPKTMLTESGVGAIHYGQIYTKYGTSATETLSFVSTEDAKKLTKADPGDIIITNTSENLEDVGKAVAWLGEDQIVTGGHATVIKHDFDTRFLSYWFQTPEFFIQKKKLATGTKVIDVSAKQLAKVLVPVPPLEIQRHIADILDTFSKMEAELEAELEARKQQYAHYRQDLLSSNAVGLSMPLGEIFEMRAGTHVKASEISDDQLETHPYRCFGGNGVRGYVSGYNYDEDVAFIGRQGALCGNVHRAQGKIYATEHAVVVTPKAEVDMSWAFHKLTEMDLNQYKTKSAQPGLAVGRIKEIVISLPNIKEQRRIVEILDKFDALVNDLSVGLPAELAARRQQYEYYRDRLLTFKELEPAS
ncbi:restriction endonuclease subunit S [Glutamicibacter sp. PS]|uniref:restriction endonuclease subunit S n=1 Tax=Glutamicibacter sp. PS TaxID=3075634 RepID=UPI0028485D7D|nr:restriction endonuclease subunit S [Glutamicibacter sp. PS]MDR4532252.1 restriction endonuclease subunit S [Glutamicibacter sp. PS]